MWSGKVGQGLCDEVRGQCGQARWVGVCVMRCGVSVVRQGGSMPVQSMYFGLGPHATRSERPIAWCSQPCPLCGKGREGEGKSLSPHCVTADDGSHSALPGLAQYMLTACHIRRVHCYSIRIKLLE